MVNVYFNIKRVYSPSLFSYQIFICGTINGQTTWVTAKQQFEIFDGPVTVKYHLNQGVNYISFQVMPWTDNIFALIPHLDKAAFWCPYSKQYFEIGNSGLRYYAKIGRAIWLMVYQDCEFKITGNPIMTRATKVAEGWNGVGPTYGGSYIYDQDNIITAIFGWDYWQWYYSTNWLSPQNGAWVYAVEYGRISMGDFPPGPGGSLGKSMGGNPPEPPRMTTEVNEKTNSLPTEFSLLQNYPNPFNPTTTITFSLPKSTTVDLTIFNVTGQVVNNLVEGQLNASNHQIQWNGTDNFGSPVPSGIYFYQLKSGEFSQVRKMQLLK